ncbi:hypothetical protein NEOLEDRAFT_662486 [Neolentinus lepideus HHB14362 ss-1]|uniref:Uncharacterized protein n=1 Tax=Neolentinus lepideus HHB14362 ss-1 TaxID=1314782 RepID=A0A165QH52_9AGAM|nr:hypothetical protein NEOLEDRAFT_662486 [Neolentinus lepideus HHB14362 ss-1]
MSTHLSTAGRSPWKCHTRLKESAPAPPLHNTIIFKELDHMWCILGSSGWRGECKSLLLTPERARRSERLTNSVIGATTHHIVCSLMLLSADAVRHGRKLK